MTVDPSVAIFAAVQVIALIVAYVKLAHELSFIKGQMTHFVRGVDKVEDIERTVSVLDRAQIKTAMDVNHAFEKIRRLKGEECNGAAPVSRA